MKISFIEKQINGITWNISKNFVAQSTLSWEYAINKLKKMDDLLLSADKDFIQSKIFTIQDWELSQKQEIVLIKSGRRKKFGLLNFLDEKGEHDAFIKVFDCSTFLLKLKHLFFRSKAKREFILSHKIKDLGISGVFSIAVGEKRRMGILQRSYLIVKKIDNTLNLKEFFYDTGLKPKDRHIVLQEFGKVVRLSHCKGIFQTDFALNNFLVQKLDDGGFQVYLIDYERTVIRNNLTAGNRFWTLAKLNRVGADFTISDKMRFLLSYINSGLDEQIYPHTRDDIKSLSKKLDRDSMENLKNGAKKMWKSCVNGGRRFKEYNGNGFKGHFMDSYNPDLLIGYINKFDNLKKVGEFEFDNSQKIISASVKITDKSFDFEALVYKFSGQNSSLSIRSWQNSNMLLKARINVPESIAVFNDNKNGYLVTLTIIDYQSWIDIKEVFQNIKTDNRSRIAFLRKLGRFVCRLHNFGIFAFDISFGDILASSKNEKYEFCFAHTYNFLFKLCLTQAERLLDVKKFAVYFRSIISDVELHDFEEAYSKSNC